MFRKFTWQLLATAALCVAAMAANAEVTDSASNGFSITHRITVAADRAQVYGAMVNNVGQWWSDDHTMSGSASNMYIDAGVPGCFCERLGNSGIVVHMAVTFVNPGVMLRLTGGLGPLGLMGVNGNMTWEFAVEDGGTRVTLTYAVGGYMPGGLDAIAPAVDAVLLAQIESLKAHAESAGDRQ